MQSFPQRKTLNHDVPFWIRDLDTEHPTFFITICTKTRGFNQLANDVVWPTLLKSVQHNESKKYWSCLLFLAMPDHVHGMFQFRGEKSMHTVIANWKRWTAQTLKIQWQDGFFDHRLRSADSSIAKFSYILDNPVRAGYAENSDDWNYLYIGNRS